MKKELPLLALGIIAAAPAFASQQSTSQGFIEDSGNDSNLLIVFYVQIVPDD
ncbi:hypothetical protein, partial [Klebsiella pneumoniae]|uniref:hypothetical protein n=1 Tax=Klebsiella pneumoniae TaxID=573 RepID=UPI0029FEC919